MAQKAIGTGLPLHPPHLGPVDVGEQALDDLEAGGSRADHGDRCHQASSLSTITVESYN